MPCNLAVSIGKAGVTQPQLFALLTPDIVKVVAFAYLEKQYASSKPSVHVRGEMVVLHVGSTTIRILNGGVQIQDSEGNRTQAQKLADEIEELLTQLANRLFQQKLQVALGPLVTQVQTVSVNNEGTLQQATIFHLEV